MPWLSDYGVIIFISINHKYIKLKFRSIFLPYLRWRHSKGFGVHSPFAYRFVITVLRPGPYKYYSYQEIDRYLRNQEFHNHRFINLVKFIIRLSIFLKTKRIITVGADNRASEVATKALDINLLSLHGNSNFKFLPHDLIIISGENGDLSMVKAALQQKVPVFAIHPKEIIRHELETPLEFGVLFNDKHYMLLIPRPEMKYVAYDIKLMNLHNSF